MAIPRPPLPDQPDLAASARQQGLVDSAVGSAARAAASEAASAATGEGSVGEEVSAIKEAAAWAAEVAADLDHRMDTAAPDRHRLRTRHPDQAAVAAEGLARVGTVEDRTAAQRSTAA